jgi:hypothetical protein
MSEDTVEELRDVLIRQGFVRCDITACNCGSWHPRYGLAQRWEEVKSILADADHGLTNSNGHLVSRALQELVNERDALRAEVAALRDDAERYLQIKHDFSAASLDIDGNHSWVYRRNFSLKGPTLDAAIDAARKGTL